MEIKSERVICILGNTLRKKYPNFNEVNRISQDDLLEWEYWSSYIKIYGRLLLTHIIYSMLQNIFSKQSRSYHPSRRLAGYLYVCTQQTSECGSEHMHWRYFNCGIKKSDT